MAEASLATSPPPPDSFWRLGDNLRVRIKDRRAHPYCREIWPECLRVERMSRDELLALQRRRIADLLADVVDHVPFYRRWAQGAGHKVGEALALEDLPVVTKETYRLEPDAFLSARFKAADLAQAKSSGSSGEPFGFRQHVRTADYSYCCMWRGLARHGLRPGQRRVYIWGRSFMFGADPTSLRRIERRNALRDWLNNTLTISAYELSEQNVDQAIDQIEQFAPVYMHGYVSALYTIARRLASRGRDWRAMRLRAAVTESEKVYAFQRQAMEEAFGCPVLENYGSVELGAIAQPDLQGRMRVNEDMCVMEVLPGGAAVLTNLMADAYPFIRYRVGDLVEFAPEAVGGLPYGVLKNVIGRTVDLLPRPGGGYVHGMAMEHIIRPHLGYVRKYQIHQEKIDFFRVKLELSSPLPDNVAAAITRQIRDLVGQSVTVRFEEVEHIPPAPSGKFRWVMSDVSDVAQQALREQEAGPPTRS